MSRADSVIESFYEDANLRGSLTDDEADVLFQWAAAQAGRLDASGADDAAFEALTDRLRQLIERINWTAGEGSYAAPEDRAAALNSITADAQAVGLSFVPPFSAQAVPAEPMEALHGLLASLEPASPPPPAPEEIETPPANIAAEAVSSPLPLAPDELEALRAHQAAEDAAAPGETDEPTVSVFPPDDEEFYDL